MQVIVWCPVAFNTHRVKFGTFRGMEVPWLQWRFRQRATLSHATILLHILSQEHTKILLHSLPLSEGLKSGRKSRSCVQLNYKLCTAFCQIIKSCSTEYVAILKWPWAFIRKKKSEQIHFNSLEENESHTKIMNEPRLKNKQTALRWVWEIAEKQNKTFCLIEEGEGSDRMAEEATGRQETNFKVLRNLTLRRHPIICKETRFWPVSVQTSGQV